MLVCLAAHPVEAAELKKETVAAFDRYVGASEGRIKSELHDGPFLFIDELPETHRVEAYAQLRMGQVLVKQVNTKEEGDHIEVPHGLIHDWIGVPFIPNASLAQTLAVVQKYDNHQNIYKPEVRHSKLLNRNGDNFKVSLQFYKKSLVTVVINADFDIYYERFGTNRAVSRSYSTRLAEVENAGQTDEREEEHPAWNHFEPARCYTCCSYQPANKNAISPGLWQAAPAIERKRKQRRNSDQQFPIMTGKWA